MNKTQQENTPVNRQQTISPPLTEAENSAIQQAFAALLEDYRHTRNGDKADLITRAFEFAKEAHAAERRASGEPYILHSIAVGRIVAKDIGLGSTSICAALLHDVVKNNRSTYEELEQRFGSFISRLVRGLTQISGKKLQFITEEDADSDRPALAVNEEQAENFRSLLLAIAENPRVILVKLADRLHDMRTLDVLPEEKQRRMANETLYLYAPIADRLGLNKIKDEMEELGLRYEHPEDYQQLKAKMQNAEANFQSVFQCFIAPVTSLLDDLRLKYTFEYRMKTVYSVWRKMQKKKVPFEEVYDLYAARIVFTPTSRETEKADCWRIYSTLTSVYKIHPNRIRDWISHPKQSGYEALQVTIMGPENNWIEVQIRSERMNNTAEEGNASHWKYKSGSAVDNELSKWMQNIKEILDNPAPTALDFLTQINLNFLSSSIYVFTTRGDVQALPKKATALDFAFSIHTDIGMHATAARIDHELMPLNTTLESGQQVEILTADDERITPQWIDWVTTPRARAKVQGWLNKNGYIAPKEKSKHNKLISSLLGVVKKKKEQVKTEVITPKSYSLYISGIDRQGLFSHILHTITGECTANIDNIHFDSENGLFKGYLTFREADYNILKGLCQSLRKIEGIEKAYLKTTSPT